MNCNRCGYIIPNGTNQCPNCGNIVNNNQYYNGQYYNNGQQYYNGQQQTCGLATASMILGITSLFFFGIFTAIPAVILGFNAKKKIAAENLGGAGQATAGIVTGFITITLFVLVLIIILVPLFAAMAQA